MSTPLSPLYPIKYNPTRLLSRRVQSASTLPSLNIPSLASDQGTFRNELVINSFTTFPALYLRVGTNPEPVIGTSNILENSADSLYRIGRPYVTSDLITATAPTLPYSSDPNFSKLLQQGETWYRTTDKAYFIHDGTSYQKLTPVPATQIQAGISQLATNLQTLDPLNIVNTITPSNLDYWKDSLELLSQQHQGRQIYVHPYIGNDDITNDGLDPYSPFLTLERALLEVARQSLYRDPITTTVSPLLEYFTILLAPGDYYLDNNPGVQDYTLLTQMSVGQTGAINPTTLSSTVTGISSSAGSPYLTLLVTGAQSAGIRAHTQIWNQIGASAIVYAVTNTELLVQHLTGTWTSGDSVIYPNYAVFNSPQGGVIVPRGCSILGADLRKTILRPLYLGDFGAWSAAVAASSCGCSIVGTTTRLKLTGGSYIANLTFEDNPSYLHTHHLCTALEFATVSELTSATYSYYKKVLQVLQLTTIPSLSSADFYSDPSEYSPVSPALSATATDADGFRLIDSPYSSSPYISNCTVRSRFGAKGIRVDGSSVSGYFKSVQIERFTCVSLQDDPNAFSTATGAPDNLIYKEAWRHTAIEATNQAYVRASSCASVGLALHYQTSTGATLSLSNCSAAFGDITFGASDYSSNLNPEDTGGVVALFIPPYPITSDVQHVPLGTFYVLPSTSTKLYVYGSIDLSRILPYSLQAGESIYVQVPSTGTEYTANLVSSAPYFASDSNGYYLNVLALNNTIFASASSSSAPLDSLEIYIKRTPDLRQNPDRIYWLEISGLGSNGRRAPQVNYLVQLDPLDTGFTLTNNLYVAAVRNTLTDGTTLPTGTYQFAIMSADGANDPTNELYPPINIDSPEANPATSRTYIAMVKFFTALGMSSGDIASSLTPLPSSSTGAEGNPHAKLINISSSLIIDFAAPSTITAQSTTLEWIGYGNYSSALPEFQATSYDQVGFFTKLKREEDGGRVYCTGLTQDGLALQGETITDLRNNSYLSNSLTNPYQEQSLILENLTVTNQLYLYPNSTFSLPSTNIVLDANTQFLSPITPSYHTYANQSQGGFSRFATQVEANALIANNVAISPATIPPASQTQQGIARFATQAEANSLLATNLLLAPATLPVATQTQQGISQLANQSEANALTSLTKTLTPGVLPIATESQQGITQLATQAEANALINLTHPVTPGRLPLGSETQLGIVKFATHQQILDYQTDLSYVTLRPHDIQQIVRAMMLPQVGFLFITAADYAPEAFLLVHGQAISRSTYSLLFGVIGTIWGAGDGTTTFNLPPAEVALVIASTNAGYLTGTKFGSKTATATTTPGGMHNHTGTTDPNPDYTPIILVVPAGSHTHTVTISPTLDFIPTGAILPSGSVTPSVTIVENGIHSHAISVSAVGPMSVSTAGSTTSASGGFTPSITVINAGNHTHVPSASIASITISGTATSLAGGHTPSISMDLAGDHSHSAHTNGDGQHYHSLTDGYGVGGPPGATAYANTSVGGGHDHTISVDTAAPHVHSLTASAVPNHSHNLPDITIPPTAIAMSLSTAGDHGHDLTIADVPDHTHTIPAGNIAGHSHTATATTDGMHQHDTIILPIPPHIHILSMNTIAGHSHANAVSTQADHAHELDITPIPGHDHTYMTSVQSDHHHQVTTSTVQPSIAVSVLIYTGVYLSVPSPSPSPSPSPIPSSDIIDGGTF